MTVRDSVSEPQSLTAIAGPRPLYRLQQDAIRRLSQNSSPTKPEMATGGGNIPQRVLNRIDRYVGTVVHLALEQLSKFAVLPATVTGHDSLRWRQALASLGLFGESLDDASDRVEQSVRRVLEDAVGRWILSPDHLQAESEFALTWVDEEGRPSDIIIDRTFVDRETNERWLVDYKNSHPTDGESLEVFAQRETNTYRAQLVEYRQVLAELGDQPVKCALYFTAVAHLQLVDAQDP